MTKRPAGTEALGVCRTGSGSEVDRSLVGCVSVLRAGSGLGRSVGR